MTATHDHLETELASGFTVRDYDLARSTKDRSAIAEAIRRRFTERYIAPVSSHPESKNGFTIMAVCCLMIESLESFRQGWSSTKNRSQLAFCCFFDAALSFRDFRGHVEGFYKHIRCGILHQAETTGGWRIRREGPMFESEALTINATHFLETLGTHLEQYCNELKSTEWDNQKWKNAIDKMDAIAKNCRK